MMEQKVNQRPIVVFNHDVTIEELTQIIPDNFEGDVVINGSLNLKGITLNFPICTSRMLVNGRRIDYNIWVYQEWDT